MQITTIQFLWLGSMTKLCIEAALTLCLNGLYYFGLISGAALQPLCDQFHKYLTLITYSCRNMSCTDYCIVDPVKCFHNVFTIVNNNCKKFIKQVADKFVLKNNGSKCQRSQTSPPKSLKLRINKLECSSRKKNDFLPSIIVTRIFGAYQCDQIGRNFAVWLLFA